MAIDLGSSNTTRYYSVPDHADFTLPNTDWTWLTLCYPQNSASTKYVISTGSFGAANSFNLYAYNSTNPVGWACRVGSLTEAAVSGVVEMNRWQWVYATRRTANYYVGFAPIGGVATESSGLGITGILDSTTGPNIGRRSDGTSDRYWNGRIGQVVFIPGSSLTPELAAELAGGASLLSMPFARNIKFLFHGRTASATIANLVSGHVATRQGTGYGSNEEDIQTPHIWTPDYIRGVESSGHSLIGAASNQGNISSTAAITQAQVLSADTSNQANATSAGTVTQNHALTGAGSAQGNEASTGAISQDSSFIGAANTQTNNSSAAGITQDHALHGETSTQQNAASTAGVTQSHTLNGATCVQANAASASAISQGAVHDLAAAASTQTNEGTGGAITQTHVLIHAPSIQDNIAAASAIVQAHILTATNCVQGNAGSTGAVVLGDVTLISTVERTAIFRQSVARSAKFQRSKSITVKFN